MLEPTCPEGKSASKIGAAIIMGILIGTTSKCEKKLEPDPRESDMAKCNEDKARILSECGSGKHNGLVCGAQAAKVCR